jgi:class 3 adenylate cyclase
MQACPPPIANAAINGKKVQPISRLSASLFFSDVVGFTTISSSLSADKVSRMLDNLFRRLDRLAYLHGVQKVDVVGDAYVAATNFTEDQPEDHAARLARFAIDAVAAAQTVPVDEEDPGQHGFLQVRAGLHSGAVTGIVGERGALKYTLVGEAVGVASRMESSGAAGRIQCSAAMALLIREQAHDVVVRPRFGVRVFCYQ